ncbi:mitochondrial carrier domain-containing protein [Lentinula edodes]|uniref:mitochondrial carrier domain-containing protein n=1 Tax=Lentinula edodes TaxID=5353 RepID=UPI001E8ED132|nr:mitochondrial carrier domain-containing protein [Lentinula edodes]KAH7880177.1 mitochondrial carrier domain-containing protein [Lentinula edodes]
MSSKSTLTPTSTPDPSNAVNPGMATPPPTTTTPKKKPYPFWLGGVAATIAASITHPLDLTKVRLQASGDKRMLASIQKTLRTAGPRGLFDGITGTWMRQMSYSMCRFWAYEESKKMLDATAPGAPAWKLGLAGSMAGGIAGLVGNPGEIVMVRLQGDFAKPPEKRFNYKHCFDALFRSGVDECVAVG